MIFVNDVEWKDWAKELGVPAFKLPASGAIFKCVEKGEPRMHDQMANGNVIGKIPLKKRGTVIKLQCTMIIDGQQAQVRYSKTAPQKDKNGNLKWAESAVVFEDGKHTVTNDLSLYWYLKNHEYCKDSKMEGKKFFYLENPVKEAEAKLKGKSLTAKAISFMWDLSDKDALEIHSIHFQRVASSAAQAKLELEVWVGKEPQAFMDLYKSEVRSIKSTLVSAEEAKIVAYDLDKRIWYWVKPDKKTYSEDDVITKIGRGRNKYDDLLDYLQNKDDGKVVQQMIEEELEKSMATA